MIFSLSPVFKLNLSCSIFAGIIPLWILNFVVLLPADNKIVMASTPITFFDLPSRHKGEDKLSCFSFNPWKSTLASQGTFDA